MKITFFILFLSFLCAQTVLADTVSNYSVSIENPKPHSSEPLIVIERSNMKDRKYVWKPEEFSLYYIDEDGSSYEEGKQHYVKWFSAYPRPNNGGFIVIKNVSAYERSGIEEIKIVERLGGGLATPLMIRAPASLNQVYWSKDGKQLFVIYDKNPWDEKQKDIAEVFSVDSRKLMATKPKKEIDTTKLIPIEDVKNQP